MKRAYDQVGIMNVILAHLQIKLKVVQKERRQQKKCNEQ
jgi:hypothetical protein